jgi:hypothetical protein
LWLLPANLRDRSEGLQCRFGQLANGLGTTGKIELLSAPTLYRLNQFGLTSDTNELAKGFATAHFARRSINDLVDGECEHNCRKG